MNVNDVITWEEGNVTAQQERKFFQKMVNDGSVWKLQGMYGRRATELLNTGQIDYPVRKTYDAYGNKIPTRSSIKKQFGRYELASRRRRIMEVA